jgi:hypothetical protein
MLNVVEEISFVQNGGSSTANVTDIFIESMRKGWEDVIVRYWGVRLVESWEGCHTVISQTSDGNYFDA